MVAVRAPLDESYLATPDAITALRHAVADYARAAGIQGEQLDAVRLAVSEAVTNVVLHAYRDGPGQVRVTVRLVENELWVLVVDDGCGLSLPAQSPGLGWGLAFITDACDDFTLAERAQGGLEARMVFRLAVDPSTASDSPAIGGAVSGPVAAVSDADL